MAIYPLKRQTVHVAVIKRYRAYVKEQGLVVTFREKHSLDMQPPVD